jgi:voltage-gated potassium channel
MHAPFHSLSRILTSVALLLGTSAAGVAGFMYIEGYSALDAFYMTVITMSTVGYGTLGDLSAGGKLFASALIIASAGTFVYAISTLTTFIIEGEIGKWFSNMQTIQKVTKLRNHIILCGLGRNGREAAIELIRQKAAFVIIELNQEAIDEFEHSFEALILRGDASHEEVLERANIRYAKGLISSLSSDAENIFITLTAREMNPSLQIVARASSESSISKLKRAGANQIILPNLIGGRKMANTLTRPALMEFVELISGESNPSLHLDEIECSGASSLLGRSLASLDIRSRTGVLVLGIKSGHQPVRLNPPPQEELNEGHRLFILGSDEQIRRFRSIFLAEG